MGIHDYYGLIRAMKGDKSVVMKMPSVKFYHNRARTLGVLLVISLFGYFVARLMIDILR